MSKRSEKLSLILTDLLMINLASLFALGMKYRSGNWSFVQQLWERHTGGDLSVGPPPFSFVVETYLEPMFAITLYWFLLFAFYGLYRFWKAQSRFDEVVAVSKVASLGTLLLFIPTFDLSHPLPQTRVVLFSYWAVLIVLVASGRVAIRTFQRHLLIRGIGRRNTIIVGGGERGRKLFWDVLKFPALGYRVVGFVEQEREHLGRSIDGLPVLGTVDQLRQLVPQHHISEILIAMQPDSHEEILKIVSSCDSNQVSFSIVPDLYHIVSGHVKTNQIYGFPLMVLMPELMPAWEKKVKRLMDIFISILVLIGFAPLWGLISLLIRLDSKGPVLFTQKRVGKHGRLFTIYKFRSMVADAEKHTGPVWAEKNDPRVTRAGRILRKLRLDEVPQFINILSGDMSLIGPRPERPFFVEQLRREVPLYSRRLNVQPGLTGWAQTKHKYDASLDDVREKLQYDLHYIESMSLRMDLKILLRTLWVMISAKGAH